MSRKVLVVSEAETFSIRGIEMKLGSIGADAVYSAPQIRELEKKSEECNLIILHTDEGTAGEADALVYIKDYCLEHDIQLIVTGTRAEYELVGQFIPASLICAFCERPLEMDKLISAADEYLAQEERQERRKNILIVDDDVSYMKLIYDWLKDKYRVAMAGSGMQAITYLARNHADLILLDYEMPITSGPQVLEMIRSEAATSDIPVMFLTGKSDRESIMRVLSLKPADYLLKTIDRKGLHEKVDNFFMTHRQG